MLEHLYKLVIYRGNPAGTTYAVRAVREGLIVLLVNHTPHIDGLPANGMGPEDILYEGWHSPLYNEIRQAIFLIITVRLMVKTLPVCSLSA